MRSPPPPPGLKFSATVAKRSTLTRTVSMQANSSNVYAEIIKWSLSEQQEKIKFSYHSLVRLKASSDLNFP